MSESEEARLYDEEFARLIREGLRCPICNMQPVRIEGVEPGTGASVECSNGHVYIVGDE
jgi:hypothetical protein